MLPDRSIVIHGKSRRPMLKSESVGCTDFGGFEVLEVVLEQAPDYGAKGQH
jgi:hypothetical protein